MSTGPAPSVVTAEATEPSWSLLMPAALTTTVVGTKAEAVEMRLTRFVICVEVRPEVMVSEPVTPLTAILV